MKESKSAVMFAFVALLILMGACILHEYNTDWMIMLGSSMVTVGIFLMGFVCGELNQSRGRQTNGKT